MLALLDLSFESFENVAKSYQSGHKDRGAIINHGSHKSSTSFPHPNAFRRSMPQNYSERGAGQMDNIIRKTNVNYDLTFHFPKQPSRSLSSKKSQEDFCHTCHYQCKAVLQTQCKGILAE